MHEMLVPLLLIFALSTNRFFNCIDENKHTGLYTDQALVVNFFEDAKVLLVDICPLRVKWQRRLRQSITE